MRLLIVGNGGREHALTWLASKSAEVEEVLVFGDNAGMLGEAKARRIGISWPKDINSQCDLVFESARFENPNLIIIGPEAPLAAGIVDRLKSLGFSVFGPTALAAQLESSKAFAKDVMAKAGVPTAPAMKFFQSQIADVFHYLLNCGLPIVIKANGLCGGKGSMVCRDFFEVVDAVHRCFVASEFGPAGHTLLVEDYLRPRSRLKRAELSVLALVDVFGNFVMFPAAQDYKPVNDGDQGGNTGGMGSFAPVPWVTPAMMEQIAEKIFALVIAEMKRRKMPFSGVLYAGLMLTNEGFKVVEFNVRFGDPEIQPLAMLLETDLMPILLAIAKGESIEGVQLKWKPGAAVCLVLASAGYPGSYVKLRDIYGLDAMPDGPDFKDFHAGTGLRAGRFIETTGGRVLDLTQYSPNDLEAAAVRVRELAGKFSFGKHGEFGFGVHFRTDIGFGVPEALA